MEEKETIRRGMVVVLVRPMTKPDRRKKVFVRPILGRGRKGRHTILEKESKAKNCPEPPVTATTGGCFTPSK